MSWWFWDQILSATVLPICLLVGFFTGTSSLYYPQSFVSNANIVVNCYLHYKSDYILLFFNSWFIDEYFQHWFSIETLPRRKLTICFVIFQCLIQRSSLPLAQWLPHFLLSVYEGCIKGLKSPVLGKKLHYFIQSLVDTYKTWICEDILGSLIHFITLFTKGLPSLFAQCLLLGTTVHNTLLPSLCMKGWSIYKCPHT